MSHLFIIAALLNAAVLPASADQPIASSTCRVEFDSRLSEVLSRRKIAALQRAFRAKGYTTADSPRVMNNSEWEKIMRLVRPVRDLFLTPEIAMMENGDLELVLAKLVRLEPTPWGRTRGEELRVFSAENLLTEVQALPPCSRNETYWSAPVGQPIRCADDFAAAIRTSGPLCTTQLGYAFQHVSTDWTRESTEYRRRDLSVWRDLSTGYTWLHRPYMSALSPREATQACRALAAEVSELSEAQAARANAPIASQVEEAVARGLFEVLPAWGNSSRSWTRTEHHSDSESTYATLVVGAATAHTPEEIPSLHRSTAAARSDSYGVICVIE